MAAPPVLLVLQYDGTRYAGWQRQPAAPTVQGELERVAERLFGGHHAVIGAGRTDAGVHARGQAAHIVPPDNWTPAALRRAMNALLPHDIWVAGAERMAPGFHARYSAIARRYTYYVGTEEAADSPFRRPYEWRAPGRIDPERLQDAASLLVGTHRFLAFAVRGTAPARDDHRCTVTSAVWRPRPGGFALEIEANRFLHHMVRFLVGTMVEMASGRRPVSQLAELLEAPDNARVAPPAPARALFLDAVTYPASLYTERP